MRLWATPVVYADVSMSSKGVVRSALVGTLHSSVDGRGLRFYDLVPASNHWVSCGSALKPATVTCTVHR